MQNFKNVKVWEKAHELALLVYQITANFPKEELFGLRSQLRKTATDIPAYIAEGCGKSNDVDFARCLQIAISFAHRLEYYFLLARDLQLFLPAEYDRLNAEIIEVKKMLTSFKQKLRTQS